MATSQYQTTFRNKDLNQGLPIISSQLDSVRAYMFEVQFQGADGQILNLAAKTVGNTGISVEDIEVRRLNDQIWFPGAVKNEELTITFDNLYMAKAASTLWERFRDIYDPMTGNATRFSRPGGGLESFKIAKLVVLELDNNRSPHASVEFYGAYPKSVKFSEKNYATSEFATIEVAFRYDFMNYSSMGTATLPA